jgi:hypothetical protein
MKIIILLFAIALAGCQSQTATRTVLPVPMPVPPAPVAMKTTTVKLAMVKVAALPTVNTVQFIYPADASNYVWSVQMSTDLQGWTTLQSGMQGAPSGPFTVMPSMPCAFYRMMGTSVTLDPNNLIFIRADNNKVGVGPLAP